MNVAVWELCVHLCRLRYQRLSPAPFTAATCVVATLRGGMCLADLTGDMHYRRSGWRPSLDSGQSHSLVAFRFVRPTRFNPSLNRGCAIFNAMFLVLCFVWFS